MANTNYNLKCPNCSKIRSVCRTMKYAIAKGHSTDRCKSCSLLGNTYKTGTKHSVETKKKMSNSALGKKKSQEHRANISKAKSGQTMSWTVGENHYNWKGGMGTERHRLMGLELYKQWREMVFAKDNYTCQICYEYGGTLHADHIERWADNESLRYETTNGRTLCVPCHYYITFKRKMIIGNKWCNYTLTRKRG